MGYQQHFTIPLDEVTARKRIIDYFNLSGYLLLYGADTVLKFERGSLKGLYPSSSPIRWYKLKVLVTPECNKSRITIDVESEYNESDWADPYIKQELKNLKVYLLKNDFVSVVFNNANKKVTFSLLGYRAKKFIKHLSYWLLISALGGIVAGIIAEKYIVNSRIALYIGFLIGFIAISFVRRVWIFSKKSKIRDISLER